MGNAAHGTCVKIESLFFCIYAFPSLFSCIFKTSKKNLSRDGINNASVFSVCNYLYHIDIFFAHWMSRSTATTKKFTRNGQFGIRRGERDVVAIWCSPYERAGEIFLFLFYLFDIIMNVHSRLKRMMKNWLQKKTFFARARDKKEFFTFLWIFAGQHFSGGWNLKEINKCNNLSSLSLVKERERERRLGGTWWTFLLY